MQTPLKELKKLDLPEMSTYSFGHLVIIFQSTKCDEILIFFEIICITLFSITYQGFTGLAYLLVVFADYMIVQKYYDI